MNTLSLPSIARGAARGRQSVAAPSGDRRLGWIERLALWADRQPPHRRLGSWTMGLRVR